MADDTPYDAPKQSEPGEDQTPRRNFVDVGTRMVAGRGVGVVEIVRQSSDVFTLFHQDKDAIDADHESEPKLDPIDRGPEHQNRNPVKVLTSGKERRVKEPFEASARIRYEERGRCWAEYNADEPLCVFVHCSISEGEACPSPQAYCAGFGVAKRWEERMKPGFDGTFRFGLAATRLPERCVMFDDGNFIGET
jgi:hypothetical protein